MKAIKIVSGGQTGADRAALDWALTHGVECGGWCPKGRKAEGGSIDPKYPLKETPSESYISEEFVSLSFRSTLVSTRPWEPG